MENKDYNEPNQDYCSPEQETEDRYSRPGYETAEEYNKAKRESEANQQMDTQQDNYQQYNYGYQQGDNQQQSYGYQQYNYNQYANVGGQMVDGAGNPLKSHFAVQLVFAIIEILLCCFSPVAMVLGIIGMVFAVQANTAYNMGRAEEFKTKSKTSTILLIVGGVFAAVSILINVLFITLNATIFMDVFDELEQSIEEEYNNDYNYDDSYDEEDDADTDEDIYEEYPGTMDEYLVEGFADFTHKGVSYTVPMSYDTFMTMGYVLEEEYQNYEFEAQSYESIRFYDTEGVELGMVRVSNDTEEVLAIEECVVDYIYFDNPASYITDGSVDHIDLTFGNGFDMFTTYEELEAWLGTPYYKSVDNSGGTEYVSYEWTYYGDDKYQSIVVSYMDGVITDIAFEQYDFVY